MSEERKHSWFAMRRGIHDHPLFNKRHDRLYVWSWMISTAAWRDTRQDAGGIMIDVHRGQILTSYRQIETATGVGVKVLRNLISALEKEGAVKISQVKAGTKPGTPKGTGRGTVRTLITICNYEKYQSYESDGGTGGGTAGGTGGAQVGHTKVQEYKDITLEANASKGADAPEAIEVSILSKAVWDAGKTYLTSRSVENPGSLIGRWLKSSTPVKILEAIETAQKVGTQDPVPYITEILNRENANQNGQPDLDALFADIKKEARQ